MIFIGVDNGSTGSVGIIDEQGNGYLFPTPTKSALNYQKTKVKHITRIDVGAFRELLQPFLYLPGLQRIPSNKVPVKVAIERPLINPTRFEATTSALRALEATLIVLESLGLGYEFMDSKDWQKKQLPYISVADKKEYPAKLKQVSKEVGMRLYPNIDWSKFKDADGILICRQLQQNNNVIQEYKGASEAGCVPDELKKRMKDNGI